MDLRSLGLCEDLDVPDVHKFCSFFLCVWTSSCCASTFPSLRSRTTAAPLCSCLQPRSSIEAHHPSSEEKMSPRRQIEEGTTEQQHRQQQQRRRQQQRQRKSRRVLAVIMLERCGERHARGGGGRRGSGGRGQVQAQVQAQLVFSRHALSGSEGLGFGSGRLPGSHRCCRRGEYIIQGAPHRFCFSSGGGGVYS